MSLDGATIQTLMEVLDERSAQDAKWGRQDHPNGTGPEMRFGIEDGTAGELRDFLRDQCEANHRAGRPTYADIFLEEAFEALAEKDPAKLRTELIQTAAVCVAWVEAIDRRQT